MADSDRERIGSISAEANLQREQVFDHEGHLRFFSAAHSHHRELDGARCVFVHAERCGYRGQCRTPRLAQLQGTVGILREEHALDRDLLGTMFGDELGNLGVDDTQPIAQRPTRGGDAALGNDAQLTALVIDDAETGAQ